MTSINSTVNSEMIKAISAILESKLSSEDNEEKRRQDRLSKAIKDRGIVADSDANTSDKDESEDEKDEDSKEKREDRTGGKGTADSKKLKVPKDNVLKTPTLGSIIDKLNALRGGKSLKDKEVKESFEQYFEGLDKSERQALLAFLTGIAQILTGVEKGGDALEPKDIGVSSKGSVEKAETSPDKQKGTDDSPIIVGESKTYDVKKALALYRKNNG
tara:strand:+ start:1279 stop:1926 length:648 start_codon:yes stop_codon:yes gene_type:complete